MSQAGVIVISDNINVDAWSARVVAENPKLTIGGVETTEQGVKYIPIEKKS